MDPTTISRDRKCAHPACHCAVKGADAYCSDHCRLTQGQGDCGCGHEACGHAGGPESGKVE